MQDRHCQSLTYITGHVQDSSITSSHDVSQTDPAPDDEHITERTWPIATTAGNVAPPHNDELNDHQHHYRHHQLKRGRLQGIVNNLRGFHGEIMAMQEAPGVVAVCKRFNAPGPMPAAAPAFTPQHTGNRQIGIFPADETVINSDEPPCPSLAADTNVVPNAQRSSTADRNGSSTQDAAQRHDHCDVLVEVDVVAAGGSAWIEVKNQERFGLESVHWCGAAGRGKGLQQQVADLLYVASYPANHRSWQPPQVVIYFPSGVADDVAAQIRHMGAHVAVGPGDQATTMHTAGQRPQWHNGRHNCTMQNCNLLLQHVCLAWYCEALRKLVENLLLTCMCNLSLCLFPCLSPHAASGAPACLLFTGSLPGLRPPPPPAVTNLDVTTLCALVSEVSYADPHSAVMTEWAAQTTHWQVGSHTGVVSLSLLLVCCLKRLTNSCWVYKCWLGMGIQQCVAFCLQC